MPRAKPKTEPEVVNNRGVAAQRLKGYVERVESLITDRKAVSDDISAVMAEAKAAGFNTKVMRSLIRLRAQDSTKRKEEADTLSIYADALGLDLV